MLCLILLHDGPKRCKRSGSSKCPTPNEMKRSNVRLEYVILWEQEKTELNCSIEQPDCCKKKTRMIHACMPHDVRQWIKEPKQKKGNN